MCTYGRSQFPLITAVSSELIVFLSTYSWVHDFLAKNLSLQDGYYNICHIHFADLNPSITFNLKCMVCFILYPLPII